MIEKSTYEKPHNFEEAKQYLAEGNHISYEVKIGKHSGALMTRETWLESVADRSFIDYDGHGNEVDERGILLGTAAPVFEGKTLVTPGVHGWIYPSTADQIRPQTKYILWYNR